MHEDPLRPRRFSRRTQTYGLSRRLVGDYKRLTEQRTTNDERRPAAAVRLFMTSANDLSSCRQLYMMPHVHLQICTQTNAEAKCTV